MQSDYSLLSLKHITGEKSLVMEYKANSHWTGALNPMFTKTYLIFSEMSTSKKIDIAELELALSLDVLDQAVGVSIDRSPRYK